MTRVIKHARAVAVATLLATAGAVSPALSAEEAEDQGFLCSTLGVWCEDDKAANEEAAPADEAAAPAEDAAPAATEPVEEPAPAPEAAAPADDTAAPEPADDMADDTDVPEEPADTPDAAPADTP